MTSALMLSCIGQLPEDPCRNRVDPEACRVQLDVCRRAFYCDPSRLDLGETVICSQRMSCDTELSMCLRISLCTYQHGEPTSDASCGNHCRRQFGICRARCEKTSTP